MEARPALFLVLHHSHKLPQELLSVSLREVLVILQTQKEGKKGELVNKVVSDGTFSS